MEKETLHCALVLIREVSFENEKCLPALRSLCTVSHNPAATNNYKLHLVKMSLKSLLLQLSGNKVCGL